MKRTGIEDKYRTILLLDGSSSGGSKWNYERAISISTKYFNILKDIRELRELDPPVRGDFERSVEALVHFTYYIAERLLREESQLAPKMASQKVPDIIALVGSTNFR